LSPSARPTLEALEDRLVPSTLTVTNLNDGDGNGPAGSLRYELSQANNGDTITFQSGLSGTLTLGFTQKLGNFGTFLFVRELSGPAMLDGGAATREPALTQLTQPAGQ
jgi:hypothetical protein